MNDTVELSKAPKARRQRLPTLARLLIRRLALLAVLLIVSIAYAIQQKEIVVQLSENQLLSLQTELIETRDTLDQHLNWHELANKLSNNVIEFQLEFELLTLGPERGEQRLQQLKKKFVAFRKELASLRNTGIEPPIMDQVLQNVWILNDIVEKLQQTQGSNDRLRLYRNSQDPVNQIKLSFKAIDSHLDKKTLELDRHVTAIAARTSAGITEIRKLFDKTSSQLIITLLVIAGSAVLILREFFGQLHTRIEMLEGYAQSISHQQASLPHFSSSDVNGRLAVQLWLASRRIRESLKQARESRLEAESLAFYDSLTGLENRRLFYKNLEQGIAAVKRYREKRTLIYMDLDNFKQVNDTLGHEAGDQLLINVADRLRNALRQEDHISRLGGDEFAILVHQNRDTSSELAGRLLSLLNEPMSLSEHQVCPSASIGIAIIREDGNNASDLMRNVDMALYQAKDKGRNNFQFFSADLQHKAQLKLALMSDMRRALKHGEFFLDYQPKYDAKSRKLIGVEALLRWDGPEKGLISPTDFIPIAEESGLIIPIGEWVIRQACQIASSLSSNKGIIPIAVNLSAKQFEDPGLLDKIMAICQEQRIVPGQLEIEVTESLLVKDIEKSIQLLQQLQDSGIHIAIDDFGTGFSSMSYLKELPVNVLKIDRCFVMELPNNKKDAAIVEAVIRLAHSLGLKVVAEGIETEEQLAFLKSRHCDIAQGFLLSKPLPLDTLLEISPTPYPPYAPPD